MSLMITNTSFNILIVYTCSIFCQLSVAANESNIGYEAVQPFSDKRLAKQSIMKAYDALYNPDLTTSQAIALACKFITSYMPLQTTAVRDKVVMAAGKLGYDLLIYRRHQGDLTKSLKSELSREGIPFLCQQAIFEIAQSLNLAAPAFNKKTWLSDAWPALLFAFSSRHLTQLSNLDLAQLLYYRWLDHNFRQDHMDAYKAATQGIELLNQQDTAPINLLADLYNGLFISQLRLGKFVEARISTSEALKLKARLDNERKWRILFNPGLLHDYVGELSGAERYYVEAFSVYVSPTQTSDICDSPPGDARQVGYALAMQGAIARKSAQFDKAREKLLCGLSILRKAKAYHAIVAKIELAKLAQETSKFEEAMKYVNAVIQDTTTIHAQLIDAWLIKCAIELNQALAKGAEPCLVKLASLLSYNSIHDIPLDFSDAPEYPIRHFQLLQLLMVFFHELGNPILSRRSGDAAIQLSAIYQSSLINPQAWNSARQSFVVAYMEIIVGDKAPEKVVQARLFELLEGPYSLEPFAEQALYSVNRQTPDLPIEKHHSTITDIASVQNAISAEEAFIRFFHYRHGLYAFVITKTDSKIIYIDSQSKINSFISEHSEIAYAQFNLNKLTAFNASALLPKELISSESGINKLIIVPDRKLESLPFAALNISADNAEYLPLIRRARVLFTTSASSYFDTSIGTPRPFSLALFGAPLANLPANANRLRRRQRVSRNEAVDVFSFLNGALDEVRGIANLFENSHVRFATLENATNEFLMSPQSRSASILHMATHGYLDPSDPNGVGIISAGPADDQTAKNGTLSLTNLIGYPLSNQLVVISGCDTQQGKLYVGSGKRSMTRGFLSQGAETVIGTLWPVQDKSTAKFMIKFYAELKRTGDSVEALRITQEDFSLMGRFKAPKYWAGFVLNSSNKYFEQFVFASN